MKSIVAVLALLLATAASAATQYTPGPWQLFISGTNTGQTFASAQLCDEAVRKLNAPPNITAGCRQSTQIKSVTLPPPVKDCIPEPVPPGDWLDGMSGTCLNDLQVVAQSRPLQIANPPAPLNGGAACPVPMVEKRNINKACISSPPVKPVPAARTPYTTARIGPSSEKPTPAGDGVGAFRVTLGPSHFNYHDPIVFPNQPGVSHCHAFAGNASTDAYTTTQSLEAANASTSSGGILNESAYWVPCMMDETFTPIYADYFQVYYKKGYNSIAIASMVPPPNGLRFVFGEQPTNNRLLAAWELRHSFNCNGNYEPDVNKRQVIPPCPAGGQIIMTIDAPNCWDGINLDSTDHRSHMSYSGGGSCDAAHPVAIPTISVLVAYRTGPNGTTGYRLASDNYTYNGTNAGYSAHADFWGAWDETIKKTWFDNCVKIAMDCHSNNIGDIAAFPPNGRRLQ